MTITKKDTIVLAVLFNIVVLAGVLATAHQLSSKAEPSPRERDTSVAMRNVDDRDLPSRYVAQEEGSQSFDEIDQLLEEYISEDESPTPPPTPPMNEAKKTAKSETKSTKTKEK